MGKETKVLFALQRLDKVKRVNVLIKSMKYIVQKISDIRLIIGGMGSEKEYLMNLAHREGIANYIHFAGFIPDSEVGDYFNLCDVFLFHSTYETFGIVLAQAMAYGKPIVTVINTAIPGVVKSSGLLVPPNNPPRMAEATVQLLNNKQMREKMGKQGRKRARELFDWDIVTSKYEQVFQEVIKVRNNT